MSADGRVTDWIMSKNELVNEEVCLDLLTNPSSISIDRAK